VTTAAVAGRILAAARAGCEELILTGGEPTLRRDLPRLVAYARARGVSRVVLETNAALITLAVARALAVAGLGLARVHAPAWGDRCDELTRDHGGFKSMLNGARALAEVGVSLELATPVITANLDEIARMPAKIRAEALPVGAWVLGVPNHGPDPGGLVAIEAAAAAISASEAAARLVELPVRLEQDTFIPPCLFERPARVARLFTLTRTSGARRGYRHVGACAGCQVEGQCPGFPNSTIEREPALAGRVRPIREDRVRRRLSVISTVKEQVARELWQDDVIRRPGEDAVMARIVRINFRCNQACHFCFVSTHLPTAEDAAIERAIRGIARAGGVLILSGGEPTLNPRLLEYIRVGKREGARAIELQTNAIRLADPALARAVADAGVDEAFISLHASCAEICDSVTNAPGTFASTVLGIDQVVASGVRARINFVFCQANFHDFPAYIDMVAARWPGMMVVVSFVATSTDVVPRTKALQPRYSDIMPALATGLARARALGVDVTGFDSMCGIPLCLVPSALDSFLDLAEVPADLDHGEFLRTEACQRCDLQDRCFGVRRGYAELHGVSEFRPIQRSRDTT
jgi:MoaA/NifB/PqqE/SkfB family radical SAM enzyme